jgi:thymidine phosphorylase
MDYLPQELIRKKRDGLALNEAEVQAFITYANNGHMSDSQIAAMAMAIFLNDMADVSALGCIMWSFGANDLRTRPWAYRRHFGQA